MFLMTMKLNMKPVKCVITKGFAMFMFLHIPIILVKSELDVIAPVN